MRSEALIVAQPSCEQWEKLPRAAKAARALADSLKSSGYTVAHPDLLDGGDKQIVERALADWFENVPTDARLILFWTGHGTSDSAHYLICRNSPRAGLTGFNAIEAGSLGPVIANCKAEKILVILDTCYSGQGAAEIASAFSRVLAIRSPLPGQERAIAVIASSHPLERAQEGIFCKAVRSVLFEAEAPRLWSGEDAFIHSEFLARAVGKLLLGDLSGPHYRADGVGQDFIPNPLYRPGLVAEVVEERAWRLKQSGGAEHFDLAARGIEVGTSGWYFAGRRRLLSELITWLEGAQHGVRIVTGPPGSGKSAVMGRVATLSDPEYRAAATQAGVLPKLADGTVPPEGIIDVAIHAKGKTIGDCARAVAQALALSAGNQVTIDVEALVAAVGGLNRRVTIMIDGLDEATGDQGRGIATRLIVPLGRLTLVRVLVGSRRSLDGAVVPAGEERHGRLRAVFGSDVRIDDLEDERETQTDIADYVRLRLAASPKHRNDPVGIAAVAERVAERADGVFLYARIVSRTLQELERLDGTLPATALEAFAHDLQARFGSEQQRVDDLLAALAWGEGKGLTRRVWPPVANALANLSYNDDDVQWVLDHAGWHIIETGEDGQAVYRLGHQALADHYRGRHEAGEAQGRIVAALTDKIAGAAWLDADRYLWRHLAAHAEMASCLEVLIRDPGYLAVADPLRLVTKISSIRDEKLRRFADVYNRVVDRLIGRPPLERFALVHLTAKMEAPDLASVLEPSVSSRWRCRWARVQSSTPYRIIGRHSKAITAIAFGTVDGRAIVVSGGEDDYVRLWDSRSGEPIGRPLEGHASWITALSLGEIDRRTVVASGSEDRTVRLWDARTGEPIGQTLAGHTGAVNGVAFGEIDGRAIVVSGSSDMTIRLWDGRTGVPIAEPIEEHLGAVTAVAVGVVDGRTVVVSGSSDQTVRLWDARTGESIGRPIRGHTAAVTAVAVKAVDGRTVVVSGSNDQTVRLWDARTGKSIGRPIEGHTGAVSAVAVETVDGRTVVVSGSNDQTLRLWDGRSGEPIGRALVGHERQVNTVALRVVEGRLIVASGSGDRTIRLWDTRAEESGGERLGRHNSAVCAIAHERVDGRAIVMSGSLDRLVLWDARTGDPFVSEHLTAIRTIALGAFDGRPVVACGKEGGIVQLSDALTRNFTTFVGHVARTSAIALGVINDRPLVVFADYTTIRMCDGRTYSQMGRARATGICTIALAEIQGRPVVVAGSVEGTIWLWDVHKKRKSFARRFRGHKSRVNTVTLGEIDDRLVVVSGSRDGTVRLWDPRTGELIGQPLVGHAGPVTAVLLSEKDGRRLVMSGSHDGTIRLWDARTHIELLAIDLGIAVTSIAHDPAGGVFAGTHRGLLSLELGFIPFPDPTEFVARTKELVTDGGSIRAADPFEDIEPQFAHAWINMEFGGSTEFVKSKVWAAPSDPRVHVRVGSLIVGMLLFLIVDSLVGLMARYLFGFDVWTGPWYLY